MCHLHLGGVRTALINYLFAKSNHGKFILRIEDTDQSRMVVGSDVKLENNLSWLGILPDESPLVGGKYGPYVQSQRQTMYQRHANILIQAGHAYPCFCTIKRLDLLRKQAARMRETPRYDGKCKSLSSTEAQDKIQKGEPHVVRFKVEYNKEYDDLLRGRMKIDIIQSGDPIILKADKFPTYHLANVVDDYHMNITHVLRGQEWLVSTPKHIAMFKAFGWSPPLYGHLPLLLNQDGSKLSKRQEAINISSLKEQGVMPNVILNLITQPGGGFIEKSQEKIYTLSQLIEMFSLEELRTNSSRVRLDKIQDINKLELKRKLENCEGKLEILRDTRKLLEEHSINNNDLTDDKIEHILSLCINRISSLRELFSPEFHYIWAPPRPENLLPLLSQAEAPGDTLDILVSELECINEDVYRQEELNNILRALCSRHRWNYSKVMRLMRGVLSTLKEGPSVAEILVILGKGSSLQRLNNARKYL